MVALACHRSKSGRSQHDRSIAEPGIEGKQSSQAKKLVLESSYEIYTNEGANIGKPEDKLNHI